MNRNQARLVIALVSGAVLAWLAVRRRQQVLAALPQAVQNQIQERIVLPLSQAAAETTAAPEAEEADSGQMTRKVGTNRRISVHGKLYGPLESELIGRQVNVLEANGELVVSHDDREIGRFPLEA